MDRRSTRSLRRLLAGIAVVAAALPAAASSSAALRVPDSPPAPTEPQVDAAEPCTIPTGGEFLTCIGVDAELAPLPAVGDETVLALTAFAVGPRRATLHIEIPEQFAVVEAAGFHVTAGQSRGSPRPATIVTGEGVDLGVNTMVRTIRLRAVAPGRALILASATAPVNEVRTDGGIDTFGLHVAPAGGRSTAGYAPPAEDNPVEASSPGAGGETGSDTGDAPPPGEPASGPVVTPPPDAETDAPAAEAPQSSTACAKGSFNYRHPDGADRPARSYLVEVWDDDGNSGDDKLASGWTDHLGRYNICFNGVDDTGSNGTEPYIRFIASNNRWRVENPADNKAYVHTTDTQHICETCTADFGYLRPADDTGRAVHAYDTLTSVWNWIPRGPQGCWDARDTTGCRRIVINWPLSVADKAYYAHSDKEIYLSPEMPDSRHTVIHEAAHAIMGDIYEDVWPDTPNCDPHYMFAISSAGCAWVEGFADWLPLAVLNDSEYRWADGSRAFIEKATWGYDGDRGDKVEGHVAGTLLDLADFAQDPFWDVAAEGAPGAIWNTVLDHWSADFEEYLRVDRLAAGYSAEHQGAMAAAFQNTIDYGFVDRLTPGKAVKRPHSPAPLHRYDTTHRYWSGVAARGYYRSCDLELQVYDDAGASVLLDRSVLAPATTDYVLVDSNPGRRDPGDYYARLAYQGGTCGYQTDASSLIELSASKFTVSDGASHFVGASDDVIDVRDTSLTAGVPTYFRVVPSGSADVDLFLHVSTATNPAQDRGEAVAFADDGGPGEAEGFSFTPSAGGFAGLVALTEKSGAYTIYRDTTAPTGSVSIADGAPYTDTRDVSLIFRSGDVQTGVDRLRFSVDGQLDTEPWLGYSGSATATLPDGYGTKTVLAQFVNNAGMVSEVVADTIEFGPARPNLVVTELTEPPAEIERGAQLTISDTVANTGPGAAERFSVTYYLSRDQVFSVGDVALHGARGVRPIPAGGESVGTKTVTVPPSAPPGLQYLIACADGHRVLTETDETDNCRASAARMRVLTPDMRVSVLADGPASIAPGGSFTATMTERNAGNAGAPPSTTRLYLSLDKVRSPDDRLLDGSRSVDAIPAMGTASGDLVVTVPADMAPGVYRLLACADDLDTVNEWYETNNCRYTVGKITVA